MIGKVKWFDDSKGYGFITCERGRDFWVHYTEIQGDGFKTLKPEQQVEFNGYETDKGFEAKEVKKL
jgi:CspA family cold shock protein